MNRSFGTYALALLGAFVLFASTLSSCSNPSTAPQQTVSPVNYSASTFFATEPLGDTAHTPFPYCYPVNYLKQALSLKPCRSAMSLNSVL